MKWFEGGIAEAVAASKRQGAVFVVFIEGDNDVSKTLSELLRNENIANKIVNGNYVAIKIEENSVSHEQFSQIYKQADKPSLFFIGKNGLPLEIISTPISATELIVKLDEIIQKNTGSFSPSGSGVSQSQILINSEQKSQEINCSNDKLQQDKETRDQPKRRNSSSPRRSPMTEDKGLVSNQSSENQQSDSVKVDEKEQKLKMYEEVIENKKEKRELEEKQKEKDDELKRRKIGQDMQKLKRWQEEQDLKQIIEQREKEKREENLARQRVLNQIAQDKAERAAKFGNSANTSQPSQSAVTPPKMGPSKPTAAANTARLQLKLPDGSSHTHEFSSSACLQDVRDFIAANLNLSFRTYNLSTMFPRREFTANDNSQTLADLQLVPNAVILILPVSASTISTTSGGFFSAIWFFFTPFITFFLWLKSRVIGFGDSSGSTTGVLPRTNINLQKGNLDGKESSSRNKTSNSAGQSSYVRKEGNIHRLSDKKDDDDENNTWNGNSTQQM